MEREGCRIKFILSRGALHLEGSPCDATPPLPPRTPRLPSPSPGGGDGGGAVGCVLLLLGLPLRRELLFEHGLRLALVRQFPLQLLHILLVLLP